MSWSELKAAITPAINRHVPLSRVFQNSHPNWFTEEIRHNTKCIRTLTRSLQKKHTSSKLSKLEQLETKNQSLILLAKIDYDANLALRLASNPKRLFSKLKHLTKPHRTQSSFWHNNHLINDPTAVEEAFNSYFNTTFSTQSDFVLPSIEFLPTPSEQLYEISFSITEVYQTLTFLDSTKSPGNDNISPKVIKHCADV